MIRNNNIKIFRDLSLVILFAALTINSFGKDDVPTAIKGILDLREYGEQFNVISLRGEWEFYWEEFVDPQDLKAGTKTPDLFPVIPSYWTQYKDDIPAVRGDGYGTYRLRVLFPPGFRDTLAMHVPIFDSSFELFLNSRSVGSNGKVSTTEEGYEAEYAPFDHHFYLTTDTIDIVIHVANFHHRQGGFWKNIALGEGETMDLKADRKKFALHTSTGTLLIFALFFFIISLLDRRDKIMLYFSLSVFGMFLRSMATVYFPITFFVEMPWHWLVRIEYIGTYIGFAFGLLYLNSLFPSKLLSRLTKINTVLFGVMILMVLIFKPGVFTYTIFIFEVAVVLFLSYYMIRSFIGVLKRKKVESIFFFSFILFLGAVINDILISLSSSAISYEYFTTIVFQLFILSQATLLISQSLSDYREKKKLSKELEYINKNLERIIEDRTRELNQKNERIASALQLKNKLFSIIAHDLKSPVASLAQYTDLLKQNSDRESDEEILNSMNHLAYSTVDLIDNLLYWGMSQRKGIQYNPDYHDLTTVLQNILNLFEQNIKNKNLQLSTNIPKDIMAYCDATLVKIILRNLISNAIKFSNEGGAISISFEKKDELVMICVEDEGVGMHPKQVKRLEKNRGIESTRGTMDEKGTGLGLPLVKELVEINKGTTGIQSKPGKGTAITFSLPGNHEI